MALIGQFEERYKNMLSNLGNFMADQASNSETETENVDKTLSRVVNIGQPIITEDGKYLNLRRKKRVFEVWLEPPLG